jgi:hypothetical protein
MISRFALQKSPFVRCRKISQYKKENCALRNEPGKWLMLLKKISVFYKTQEPHEVFYKT